MKKERKEGISHKQKQKNEEGRKSQPDPQFLSKYIMHPVPPLLGIAPKPLPSQP